LKKIPEKLCAQRRKKQKEKNVRTAKFPEVLDQGGTENIAIGFDKTEDGKETRIAKFLEKKPKTSASKFRYRGALKTVPNIAIHCQLRAVKRQLRAVAQAFTSKVHNFWQ